eukprot:356198-Chlamydomonas_euryale.AAC.7
MLAPDPTQARHSPHAQYPAHCLPPPQCCLLLCSPPPCGPPHGGFESCSYRCMKPSRMQPSDMWIPPPSPMRPSSWWL